MDRSLKTDLDSVVVVYDLYSNGCYDYRCKGQLELSGIVWPWQLEIGWIPICLNLSATTISLRRATTYIDFDIPIIYLPYHGKYTAESS